MWLYYNTYLINFLINHDFYLYVVVQFMQLIFNSWFFKLFYKHYWLTFYSYLYFIYLIEGISIKYFFLLICSKKKQKMERISLMCIDLFQII